MVFLIHQIDIFLLRHIRSVYHLFIGCHPRLPIRTLGFSGKRKEVSQVLLEPETVGKTRRIMSAPRVRA